MYGRKLKFFNESIEHSFYSFNMADDETRQRILEQSKQMEYLFWINILLMSISNISQIIKKENEAEGILHEIYLRKTFPNQANLLLVILYVLFMVLGFYLAFEIYTMIYLCMQQIFQFYILNDCISYMLKKRYKFREDLELPYIEVYQKKVFKRLTFCVKYHEMLMR